jgi:hypothetical protein
MTLPLTASAIGATATTALPLIGRRIQIAGSASGGTDPALVRYAHEVVAQLVRNILSAGGGIVAGVGKEPRPDGASPDAPSLIFDWTALEVAADCIEKGGVVWPSGFGLPVALVSSEKSESEIPDSRRPLHGALLRSGKVRAESIMAGSRAAAFLRQRQAEFGDALVVIGGGTGVEHSADLYVARRKPVIPLDLALGASRDDGTGGALRLAKQARAEPTRFFRFSPSFAGTEGAALSDLATRNGGVPAIDIAGRMTALLSKLARPDAFYVRLLNPDHDKIKAVESFFRDIVDPVVDEAGMNRIEIGTDKSEHAFINVAIFESLHFAALAIVDVTGERPNCFIELGYALGNANRVLVTAQEGTKLPFDQQMIPCHFWKLGSPVPEQKKSLVEFWEKHINRPPIVQKL